MKIEFKSLAVGLLIGIVVMLAMGIVKEEKPLRGDKVVVKDNQGRAVVINLDTAKATRVSYTNVSPPNYPVELHEYFTGRD